MTHMLQRIYHWFKVLPQAVRWLLLTQATLWLLAVVLRLTDALLHDRVLALLVLDGTEPSFHWLWVWGTSSLVRPATDMLGLVVDLVLLVSLGRLFGHRWRRNHFLVFWATAVLVSSWVHVAACQLAPLIFGIRPAFGSQGPIMALLAAFGLVFGEHRFQIWGIERPVKGLWVVLAVIGFQLLFFVLDRNSQFALQVGGLLAGWLLVTGRWRPERMSAWLRGWMRRLKARRRGIRPVAHSVAEA